jgi:hypothetical protein
LAAVFGKAKRRRELLLVLIPGVIAIADAALVYHGLASLVVWLGSVVLFVWPIYLITEKFAEDQPELSYLQSIRATIYFTELGFLLFANGFLIVPSNPVTFLYVPLVSLTTVFFDIMILRGYRDEIRLFDEEQNRFFIWMIFYAGSACIWLSMAIVQFNLSSGADQAVVVILDILIGLLMGFLALLHERRSVKLAQQLAGSLKATRWQRRANSRRKRRAV